MIEFWTNFFAVFSGVVLAFLLNWVAGQIKNRLDRNALLGRLYDELTIDLRLLNGKGNILNDRIWHSALAAGQVRLLKRNQVLKLTEVYQSVSNTVYEAIRVRDLAEYSRRAGVDEREQVLRPLLSDYIERLKGREKKLRRQIRELLKCSWFQSRRTGKA